MANWPARWRARVDGGLSAFGRKQGNIRRSDEADISESRCSGSIVRCLGAGSTHDGLATCYLCCFRLFRDEPDYRPLVIGVGRRQSAFEVMTGDS